MDFRQRKKSLSSWIDHDCLESRNQTRSSMKSINRINSNLDLKNL